MNRTESIRIANWNALVVGIVQMRRLLYSGHVVRMQKTCCGHYAIRTYYRSKSKRETTRRKWTDNIRDDCSDLGLKLLEATKHAVRSRRAWISAVYNLGCVRMATASSSPGH